jgi:hypothetical protein
VLVGKVEVQQEQFGANSVTAATAAAAVCTWAMASKPSTLST